MILFFKVEICVFAIFGHENCRNCKTFGLWKIVRGCAQAARNDINGAVSVVAGMLDFAVSPFFGKPALCWFVGLCRVGRENC